MNFRRPGHSLLVKFSFLTSLPVLMASLALSSSFIRHNLTQIEAAMSQRGGSMVRDISIASEYGLLIQNKEILNEVIHKHSTEEGLLYMAVRDLSDEILASYGEVTEDTPGGIATSDPTIIEREPWFNCRVFETDLLYDITCDVLTIQERRNRESLLGSETPSVLASDTKKIGSVQVGLSKASMMASMRNAKLKALWLTAGAVALAVLGTVLLIRLMVRPIKQLAIAAGEVSRGNFGHSVAVKSRDEIGDLAISFNRMTIHLRESRESLQHRLEVEEQIARELEGKTKELSRSNEELDAFVYTVSHDLKAPLVTLQGFSGLLLSDCKDQLDENGRMYIERIQKNTERMGELIEKLLKLSRIGRAKVQEEPVDTADVISDVADELALQLREKQTTLTVMDNMPAVVCDRTSMHQIFANLISNANKYIGADNQNPVIEVGYNEHDSDYTFYVKDNGIGIAEEYHGKIFQILQRLNEIEVEGTGMGLTIVKKIVDGFGGSIWVDSTKGEGTTVYFTVPEVMEIRNVEGVR
ncbi:ATP-binding protein [Candidatus Poribacteria bacterium]